MTPRNAQSAAVCSAPVLVRRSAERWAAGTAQH
jgi:hypothetical protein